MILTNKIKYIFKVFVAIHTYFSFGVAVCGASFALLLLNKPSLLLFFIIFLQAYSLFALNKLTDKEEDKINHPDRYAIVVKHEKFIRWTTPLAYITALILAVNVNLNVFLISLLLLFLGVLYSAKIIPFRYSRLKDVPFGKSIAIGLGYVIAMVLIPTFFYHNDIIYATIILSIFIFLRSVINSNLFDIRDVTGDIKQGIITIPTILGAKNTIRLFYVINTFLGALIFYSAWVGLLPPITHVLNLSTLFVYIYLFLLNKPKIINQKFLYEIIIDGEYLFIGVTLLLTDILISILW